MTISSNTLRGSKRFGSPFIGENVYIGTGAKIIGNIQIGDNCRIGANAVVFEDMPDNSVAVNSPTRIIEKEEQLDNRFFFEEEWKMDGLGRREMEFGKGSIVYTHKCVFYRKD